MKIPAKSKTLFNKAETAIKEENVSEKAEPLKNRWGSKEVEITEVKFFGEDRKEKYIFNHQRQLGLISGIIPILKDCRSHMILVQEMHGNLSKNQPDFNFLDIVYL